jgi:hypothetical protein
LLSQEINDRLGDFSFYEKGTITARTSLPHEMIFPKVETCTGGSESDRCEDGD